MAAYCMIINNSKKICGRESLEKYDRTLQVTIFTAAVNETNNVQTKYKTDQILLHSILLHDAIHKRGLFHGAVSVCLSGWLARRLSLRCKV